MNEIYVHHLSPFLIQFTENVGIRWYGLAYISGFVLSWYFANLMAKKNRLFISGDQVWDFITYGAFGTMIGGRVGYCLFYDPSLLTHFSGAFPFWGVLEVHKGGMASHGGILGIIVAAILYARKEGISKAHVVDLCCLGGALGIFFGRIANFINGELYGRECSSSLSWAVKFPAEIHRWGIDDTEKLKLLADAAVKISPIQTAGGGVVNVTHESWLQWVTSMGPMAQRNVELVKDALVSATLAGDGVVASLMGPALTPRYPSQLIQALLEGLVLFLVLAWVWRKPQKVGVITGMFGVVYSLARIVGEQFRLPDAQIGFEALGLTRGQWLSVALLIGCFLFLVRALKSNWPTAGGFFEGPPVRK
jgi:phosphatidylglycerol:prolipoprotein diacylglycerol transferase